MGNHDIPLPPLMTGSDTSPIPSVHFNATLIVLAAWDIFETPLFCLARVTILIHFGASHGQPRHPFTPLMTDSYSYLLPSVHINENGIVQAAYDKFDTAEAW